ncbi:DUF2603 domain-containing protein [Campylobacter sp. FMV-PI01]|uniref:UPF0763 protein F1B92_04070 n=1 Tax=Campylobacter portucalensis TaxID=2608384 RepID=A0A6L5WH48_9BACT|nr:DUF2603 domain-containing protein [Campylobacter portucalensis]MSN96369.1 DUF2603 domain-containing protein [Campylobacter portucalensis]
MGDEYKIYENEIEQITQILGSIKSTKQRTVFDIIDNDNTKTLILKSGSWKSKEPWFGVDKDSNLHTMVCVKTLNDFIESYRNLAKENFELRLEKIIMKYLPVDFGDVWSVCLNKIGEILKQNPNLQILNIDLNQLVKKIKQDYPNLFVNLDTIME